MSKAPSSDQIKNHELLAQAQAGDQKAFETLLERYTPLIEAMTAQFSTPDTSLQDREDLRQEAWIALCGAVTHYRPDVGSASFGTFAKVCIRHRLISHLRTSSHQIEVLPLEAHGEIAEQVNPASHLVEEEAYRELYRNVRSKLSDLENRIWWLYLSGLTAKEVAHQLQCDEKAVQNAIYRIRKKLRSTIQNT
ncbi:MAG: sigma-70 family RNA polymerase sigma factor [Clostridia bacterium]|nr:sigma-70 family RNA polymerase sigma factor [Clostridia bacterium]